MLWLLRETDDAPTRPKEEPDAAAIPTEAARAIMNSSSSSSSSSSSADAAAKHRRMVGSALRIPAATRLAMLRRYHEKGINISVYGNSINQSMIATAVGGLLDVIKLLHELVGADVVNEPDEEGQTPVYLAAVEGEVEPICALHALGADINKADNVGSRPVDIAAVQGHKDVVKVWRKLGAGYCIPSNNFNLCDR